MSRGRDPELRRRTLVNSSLGMGAWPDDDLADLGWAGFAAVVCAVVLPAAVDGPTFRPRLPGVAGQESGGEVLSVHDALGRVIWSPTDAAAHLRSAPWPEREPGEPPVGAVRMAEPTVLSQ